MNKRNYEQKPLTKKDFIVVEESLNEALIYDSDKNKLHVLTPVATTVWKSCDGKTSVSEIASKLKAELNDELGADATWLALEELEKNGLLENSLNIPRNGISRRDLIKTAAVSLPLITTMIAPSPARAQSAVQMGGMMMGMMMQTTTAARSRFDPTDGQNKIVE
ncbi:MAG: PqqD family protein [Blastocatellia bacterium]